MHLGDQRRKVARARSPTSNSSCAASPTPAKKSPLRSDLAPEHGRNESLRLIARAPDGPGHRSAGGRQRIRSKLVSDPQCAVTLPERGRAQRDVRRRFGARSSSLQPARSEEIVRLRFGIGGARHSHTLEEIGEIAAPVPREDPTDPVRGDEASSTRSACWRVCWKTAGSASPDSRFRRRTTSREPGS